MTNIELMTVREMSQASTIAEDTFYFWRAHSPEKGPKTFKLGRRVVAHRADFDAWIAEQERATMQGGAPVT